MKKRTIIILAVIMGISFVSLLFLQVRYMEAILDMRRQHFEESVKHALYEVTHQLELAETARYLEEGPEAMAGYASLTDTVLVVNADSTVIQRMRTVNASDGNVFQMMETTASTNVNDKYFTKRNSVKLPAGSSTLREIVQKRYTMQKALVDELIYSILYTASDRPLQDRIDFTALDQALRAAFARDNIDLTYHFSVSTSNGQCVYQCPDYDPAGSETTFTETLFKNDPIQKMGTLQVHFPELRQYLHSSIAFITPSVVFTLILLVTFTITLLLVFRQKKLSQMKNDFINNMTHEFKTPISTISLAAQMLNDDSVRKSPKMLEHITNVIGDETKRLRFQVEKVLQMSMFERQKATLKLQELDITSVILNVVNTYKIKVEKIGGQITTELDAEDSIANLDEMHFTNVIFNLLDNAFKYRREDVPLALKISTRDIDGDKIEISVADNGIGIKKEDLKKIFDKFYRVSTGNRHDVKGFGLGLAYVNKMVRELHGDIRVESEVNVGSKFIITLPLLK